MPIVGYNFQGYLDDDAQMIYQFLVDNWQKGDLGDKTVFFYNEEDDPATFDFKNGEIAIRIYADEIVSDPKGIGYDSESSTRSIRIDIRGIDRQATLLCRDQIRHILAQYRLYPGNRWQTLQFTQDTPIYPSFKFYHTISTFTLRKYYEMLPTIPQCTKKR